MERADRDFVRHGYSSRFAETYRVISSNIKPCILFPSFAALALSSRLIDSGMLRIIIVLLSSIIVPPLNDLCAVVGFRRCVPIVEVFIRPVF
ncbi:MAG: hypothetical protein WC262_10355, partial [Bacteroidales bacterium]